MASSLSSSTFLRLLSIPHFLLRPSSPKSPFLLTFSSPISFQSLSTPIKSQLQSSSSSSSSSSHQLEVQVQVDPTTTTLPPNLLKIVNLFQSVPDPKSKYQQLLHYSTQLPPFPPHFKNDAHRVRGCVSQVWVRAYPDPDNPSLVRFDADSDSQLTKGLAALLVFGLSGETPAAVAAVSPDFITLLGLKQSLTPSRNNGFVNMLKLMQEKALQIGGLQLTPQDEILNGETAGSLPKNDGFQGNLEAEEEVPGAAEIQNVESEYVVGEENDGFDDEVEVEGSNGGVMGGRRERIRDKLERELNPVELEVEDISHQHAGHAGVRGNTSGETHFNLRVVSKEFEGKSLVKRHRLVYDLLREELESGLHALSIVAKSPTES